MSSEYLGAAAQALGGAPEPLVLRSAEARASAAGTTVEEVLRAWAGGGSPAPAAPAPAAPPEEVPAADEGPPAEAAPVASPAEEAPAAAPPPAAEEAPAAAAAAVAAPVEAAAPTLEAEPLPVLAAEPVEAAPLRGRLALTVRLGAVGGLLLGVIGALLTAPFLLERASMVGEPGTLRAAVEVRPGALLVVVVSMSGLFGALLGVVAHVVPGWWHPEFRLAGTGRGAAVAGGLSGLLLGAVASAVLLGAVGDDLGEGVTALPVRATMVWLLLGGALLGGITAGVAHALGVPAAVGAEERAETEAVRKRLSTSLLLPLGALGAVALLVLPFAWLLLTYHDAAPLLALFVAGSVLAFAAVLASRPKVRLADVFVAVAGVGVVLLMVVAVLVARGE